MTKALADAVENSRPKDCPKCGSESGFYGLRYNCIPAFTSPEGVRHEKEEWLGFSCNNCGYIATVPVPQIHSGQQDREFGQNDPLGGILERLDKILAFLESTPSQE